MVQHVLIYLRYYVSEKMHSTKLLSHGTPHHTPVHCTFTGEVDYFARREYLDTPCILKNKYAQKITSNNKSNKTFPPKKQQKTVNNGESPFPEESMGSLSNLINGSANTPPF